MAVAALATSTDVQSQLGRALTAEETNRVDSLLARASAYVRAETNRLYFAGPVTVRRRARRDGSAVLDDPSSVEGVREVYGGVPVTVTGWTLNGPTLYGLIPGARVEVDYTSAGTVPEAIVETTAALAMRLLTAPGTGLAARQAGPLMEQYRGVSDAATDADKAILDAHRLRLGAKALLP